MKFSIFFSGRKHHPFLLSKNFRLFFFFFLIYIVLITKTELLMNILFFSSSIKISVYVPKNRRHRIQNKWQKMVFYSAKKENETKQQEEKRLMTLRWTKRREKYGKKEIKCETRRMEHVETKMFTRERIISFFPSSSLSASTAFWLDVGWKCEAEYTYDEREHKREWTKWRDDYIFCVLSKLSHALRKCSNSRQRKRIKY